MDIWKKDTFSFYSLNMKSLLQGLFVQYLRNLAAKWVSPNNLNSVIRVLDKYKNLQMENVMANFVRVYSEDFTSFKEIPPTQSAFGADNDSAMEGDDDVSQPSIHSSDEMPQQVLPSPSQPKETEVMQTAVQVLVKRKSITSKTEYEKTSWICVSNAQFWEKLFAEKEKIYKKLCDIQKAKKLKRLNQDIECKKKNTISLKVATIAKLWKEVKDLKEVEAKDKDDIERELQQLKQIHKRLKNSNKLKCAEITATNSTVISLEEYSELQSKLGAKDERITSLEMEKTCLEETLEELRKNSAKKKDKKRMEKLILLTHGWWCMMLSLDKYHLKTYQTLLKILPNVLVKI